MKKAFTLIELLIVVAIIAILAAIAVPNFVEAQVRAKISRIKSDMRTLTTGLESYAVDYNSYPPCHQNGIPAPYSGHTTPPGPTVLLRISTPISYVSTAIFQNPINADKRVSAGTAQGIVQVDPGDWDTVDDPQDPVFRSYLYQSGGFVDRVIELNSSGAVVNPLQPARKWILHSPGPTQVYMNLGGVLFNSSGDPGMAGSMYADCLNLIYDPTNGTISFGAIWRAGGATNSGEWGLQMMKAAQEGQR